MVILQKKTDSNQHPIHFGLSFHIVFEMHSDDGGGSGEKRRQEAWK